MLAVPFDTPINTNDLSVDRVLNAGLPVILVFLDGGATPLDQTLDRLAQENAGKLLVARVRAGDNPETVRRFQISRLPAVVALRDGKDVSKAEAVSGSEVEKHAAYLLGKGPRPEAPSVPQGAIPGTQAGPQPVGGKPQKVTDATFDRDVLQSPEPVLVDFWAPWCGPCRFIEPVVEKMAAEMPGRLRVAKVNVDENPVIAQRYGVYSIPTMMVVRNGKIIDRWAGALPEPALRSRVAASLGNG